MKGVESVDKLATQREALHMVVNGVTKKKYRDTKRALSLGIERRNLKKHSKNIQSNQFKWVGFGCRRQSDALSQEIIENMDSFGMNNTRASPNKKDVGRQQISQAKYNHPKIYLGDN